MTLEEGIDVQVADKLTGIELLDADGRPTVLETLWGERSVVLVFIRHFG